MGQSGDIQPVALTIIEPKHNSTLSGPGKVTLRAVRGEPQAPALSFRWYSSLQGPPQPTDPASARDFALNQKWLDELRAQPKDDEVELSAPGPHVITLSARDTLEDTADALLAAAYAGLAGGPAACVVHVYNAVILAPRPEAHLKRGRLTLCALAPASWGQPGCQAISRLSYRWRLAVGPAYDQVSLSYGSEGLTFVPGNDKEPQELQAPHVRCEVELWFPLALRPGAPEEAGTLSLWVEDTEERDGERAGFLSEIPVWVS